MSSSTPGPLRFRLRTALVALRWAMHFECIIRRQPLAKLAARAGMRCDFAPTQPSADDALLSPCLSGRDVLVLRTVSALYRRWPVQGTCLRECLVAGRLLRYRAPVLRIGVQPGIRVQAHAWLEFDGIAIDPEARNYAMLTSR